MDRRIVIGAALLVLAAAGPVLAGFGAADLIYIPVVSHNPGAGGTQWRTDLYITNVDDTAIDVAIAYLPSGQSSNSYVFTDRSTWLGGRESDEFGFINEELADIPVNGTVVVRDIIGEYWVSFLGSSGNGAMVIAVYEADTLEPDGTRVYKNGIANARIYNQTTIWVEDPENPDELIEKNGQYGQTMPGVPWYNLADGGAVGEDYNLSYEELTGGQEGGGLRFNVGVVNASDPLTTLTIQIQPFQPDGEPYLDADDQEILTLLTMPPASHIQLFRPYRDDWGLEDVDVATVRVSLVAWASAAAEPVPMMTSYGSIVNNNTGDPSSVLPSFAYPYNVDCIWGGGGEGVGKGASVTRRPVEIPPQARIAEGD